MRRQHSVRRPLGQLLSGPAALACLHNPASLGPIAARPPLHRSPLHVPRPASAPATTRPQGLQQTSGDLHSRHMAASCSSASMRLTRPSSSPAAAQRLARSLPQLPRPHATRSEARQRAQLRVAATAPAAKPAAAAAPAKPTPPAKDRWHKPAAATAGAEGSSAAPASPAPRSNGATSSGDDDWPAQTGVLLIKCDDSKGVVASVAQVGAAVLISYAYWVLGAGGGQAGLAGLPPSARAAAHAARVGVYCGAL